MLRSLSLPFRNILRNRRRSLATIVTAALGVSAMLVFGGYAHSVIQGVATETVRTSGHLQIQRKGYFLLGAGSPAEFGIPGYGKIISALRTDPGLAAMTTVVTPLLSLQGIAGNFGEGVSQTVAGKGVVPGDQNRMRLWNGDGSTGAALPIPLPEDEPEAASIGIGLARILRLEHALGLPGGDRAPEAPTREGQDGTPADLLALAGQEPAPTRDPALIDLLAATASGAPNVVRVKVAATESLGVKDLDDRHVALHLPLAQRLVYGHAEPGVTSIVIQLARTAHLPAARDRVERILAAQGLDLEVLDYRTLNPVCGQIQGLFRSILGFFAVLIGTIILFSVANVMSSAVIERTSEIGTLRALGMRRRGVMTLFLAEGALLGSIGTAFGCVLALATAFAINHAGLSWTPPNYSGKVPLVIQLAGNPGLFLQAFTGLSLLSMVSAVLPARRASRIPVVDALRHV